MPKPKIYVVNLTPAQIDSLHAGGEVAVLDGRLIIKLDVSSKSEKGE